MDIKEQRLSFIVNEIITNGQVDIKSIAKKLNVSQMTIYRDVDDFISSGVVRKEKGVLFDRFENGKWRWTATGGLRSERMSDPRSLEANKPSTLHRQLARS